jgi:transposase-like protein
MEADRGDSPTRVNERWSRDERSHFYSLLASAGSYASLARLLGVSAKTLFSWRSGRSRPREALRQRMMSLPLSTTTMKEST